MNHNLLPTLVAVLAMVAGAAAHAEKARTPTQGGPALEIEVPGGWKSSISREGTLVVDSASGGSRIWLQVLSGPNLSTTPLEQIAGGFFKNIRAGQYSRVDSQPIDRRASETYAGAVTSPSGYQVPVVVTLARLDPQNVAFLAYVSQSRGSKYTRTFKGIPTTVHGGEDHTLNIIVDEVRIIGFK